MTDIRATSRHESQRVRLGVYSTSNSVVLLLRIRTLREYAVKQPAATHNHKGHARDLRATMVYAIPRRGGPRRGRACVVTVVCRVVVVSRAAAMHMDARRRSSFDPNLHTSCTTTIQTLSDSYPAIKIDGIKDASSTQPKLKGSAIKDWQG